MIQASASRLDLVLLTSDFTDGVEVADLVAEVERVPRRPEIELSFLSAVLAIPENVGAGGVFERHHGYRVALRVPFATLGPEAIHDRAVRERLLQNRPV